MISMESVKISLPAKFPLTWPDGAIGFEWPDLSIASLLAICFLLFLLEVAVMRSLTSFFDLACGLTVIVLVIGNRSEVRAQSITQIEEDWELDLNTPNSLWTLPQLNCVTSAGGDLRSMHAVFLVDQTG